LGTAPQEVIPIVGGATRHPGLLTFSSDYGPTDEYVGVCHLVIAGIAPDVRVVDLVHGIRGIRAGATLLCQSLPFAPPGVHLAIVDPGVGTERRAVVIGTQSGSLLVGPDNGLLTPAADVLGGPTQAFELENPEYQLSPVSATFHGRDVFAPAAAHLSLGVSPESFGTAVDVTTLVRLSEPRVEVSEGRLVADVLRTDWYGNLQLAARADDLGAARFVERVRVSGTGEPKDAKVGRTFADADAGELVIYVDSGGHVALASNRGSARDLLGDPDRVTISTPGH
jgi:S-adenosyl-L-methionine hydrolase (adenosine-forming)